MADDQIIARVLREVAEAMEHGNPPSRYLRIRADELDPPPEPAMESRPCRVCRHLFLRVVGHTTTICPDCYGKGWEGK